jgi:Undecaprenyl-phosphate glucose phosphotransferase
MSVPAAQPATQPVEPHLSPSVPAPQLASVEAPSGKDRRGPFRPENLTPVRRRLNGATLARLFRSVDAALLMFTALAAAEIFGPVAGSLLQQPVGEVLPFFAGALAALGGLAAADAYRLSPRERLLPHLGRVLAALTFAVAIATVCSLAAGQTPLNAILAWGGVAAAAAGSAHLWAWTAVRGWRKAGRLTPNIVVVGATENAAKLIESALENRDANVLAIFDDRAGRVPPMIHGVPVLGNTNALMNHMILPYVDRIVITVTASAQDRVRALIERLRVLPNAVTLFVDLEGQDGRKGALTRIGDAPLAQVSGVQEDEQRAAVKRVQDLVIGGLGLIAISPVMLLVALLIKLEDGGPVFFRQRRHGFNNETIVVWKFRSMKVERADATASQQVKAGDDRVTRIGRIIRKTSVDELPQLFNVMTGEMSLVGPRPHAIGMKTAGEDSARLVAEYAWRHRMKPGLTGWAQINGSVGPVDTPEAVRRRVALDVEYIERQSFWLDLYILLVTVPRLIAQRDIVR